MPIYAMGECAQTSAKQRQLPLAKVSMDDSNQSSAAAQADSGRLVNGSSALRSGSTDGPLIWIALRFLQSHACKSPILLRTVPEGAVSDPRENSHETLASDLRHAASRCRASAWRVG